ncbi:hypothetical protein KKG36_00340 [Patescibacteria group bacterium]|nr:hypothetical protein [Patescibacteria group bacterium]
MLDRSLIFRWAIRGILIWVLGCGLAVAFWLYWRRHIGTIPEFLWMSRFTLDVCGMIVCAPVFAFLGYGIWDEWKDWLKARNPKNLYLFFMRRPLAKMALFSLLGCLIVGIFLSLTTLAVISVVVALALWVCITRPEPHH